MRPLSPAPAGRRLDRVARRHRRRAIFRLSARASYFPRRQAAVDPLRPLVWAIVVAEAPPPLIAAGSGAALRAQGSGSAGTVRLISSGLANSALPPLQTALLRLLWLPRSAASGASSLLGGRAAPDQVVRVCGSGHRLDAALFGADLTTPSPALSCSAAGADRDRHRDHEISPVRHRHRDPGDDCLRRDGGLHNRGPRRYRGQAGPASVRIDRRNLGRARTWDCPFWPPPWSPSRSSPSGSGPSGWPAGWSMVAGLPPIRR